MSWDRSAAVGRVRPGSHGSRYPLSRLDAVLGYAMQAARARFGDEAAADPFRGLYLSADQAASALDREAGSPLAGGADRSGLPCWREILAEDASWARLQASYGLSDAELGHPRVRLSTASTRVSMAIALPLALKAGTSNFVGQALVKFRRRWP